MQLIRSRPVAGQAAALAQAGAERQRRATEDAEKRMREEGRQVGLAESKARVEAAERRAQEAEQRAQSEIARTKAEAEQRLGKAASALESAVANLSGLERQVVASAEGEIVRLGMAVAARILAREVTSDPTWMRQLLTTALSEVPDRRRVEIRCAPADAAEIRRLLPSAAAAVPGSERLELAEDPSLSPGALVLAAQGTRLDASVAASWERIAHQMLAATPAPPLTMRQDGSEIPTPAQP